VRLIGKSREIRLLCETCLTSSGCNAINDEAVPESPLRQRMPNDMRRRTFGVKNFGDAIAAAFSP